MDDSGWPSLCLKAEDLEVSKRFYETLGMEVVEEVPGKRVVLRFGGFGLALMSFLDENLIYVRGGDVFDAEARLRAVFPDLEGEPETYRREDVDADADGACWTTRDPDGNMVFFDRNENDGGPEAVAGRTAEILDGAIQALVAIDAGDVVGELRRLRSGLP